MSSFSVNSFLNGPPSMMSLNVFAVAKGTPSLLHGLQPAKSSADAEDETDLDPVPSLEGGSMDPGGENEGSQGQEQDAVAGSTSKTTDNQTILRLLEEGEKVRDQGSHVALSAMESMLVMSLCRSATCTAVPASKALTLLRVCCSLARSITMWWMVSLCSGPRKLLILTAFQLSEWKFLPVCMEI